MPNPATLVRGANQDSRIPGLGQLPAGTDRTTLSVPVYDPRTDTTYQAAIDAGDGSVSANSVVGGHKQVQYRSALFYQVPADATTLDRLVPATIVPGTLATVDNPSDNPFATTLPARQYVATRTSSTTVGAVKVPAYIGAAPGDVVHIVWVEVASGGGAGTVQSVDGIGPNGAGNVELPASDLLPSEAKRQQVVSLFSSGSQTTAADVHLSGDPRTDYLFATFYDFAADRWYSCLPNPTAPDGQGNATAWWVRR